MASIFDLKTSVEELSSSNEGLSKCDYEQHPPTRDITGSNFANGAIHFRFQTSGQKWWLPHRSYIRTRFELTQGDGTTQIASADQIAPNMGLMSTLFQSGEMRINDKPVSRVPDFMAQVDALETRLSKSKSWLDTVGEATNWWSADQAVRQQEVSSDGVLFNRPTSSVSATTGRVAMGFDAAGGAGAGNRNSWAYTANTGALVYARGTDAAGLTAAQASAQFPVGSFFEYLGLAAGITDIKMKVLANDGAGALFVERLVGTNVAADGRVDFQRTVLTPTAGDVSRRAGDFELVWAPPLSLFKVCHAMPSGRYELILNPQTATSYQKRAIESLLGAASKTPTLPGGAAADFKLNVVNMYLYIATVDGPRADDITYLLDLEQTRCQAEKIDSASFGQKNFDVSPSTFALTVAYADLRAGENTALSVSKFKSYDAAAIPTLQQELLLNRLYINYAGQNMPAPDADPSFVGGTDYTIQRYAETQINSGAYFDSGGGESIDEFHERGSYYYFRWPRDGTDRSTRVIVNQGFNGADVANMRVLLFDHSKQVARIRIQNGQVVDVQLEDA